ncbi:MAG TPA: SpoVR family protein [Candidatus Fraserbacteria bacterium]|nr:SpoVR family protein [Candidatus Fraserbacteria bacterium]
MSATMFIDVKALERLRREARRAALGAGLDPWEVIFGVVGYDDINAFSAYDGFPERFPHWQFGMAYDYHRKHSAYAGWWTYELVLNTRPAIAFLRESNSPLEHKAVMVHVYGHVDFFKHNRWFSKTPKNMIQVMRNHAERIEAHMDEQGRERVEQFIDRYLSIQYNIDPLAPFIKRRWHARPAPADQAEEEVPHLHVKRDYMERFVNPPRWLESQRAKSAARREERGRLRDESELERPQQDLLWFLIQYGRLENWQADILAMLREESYYFVPQIQTKVMNEGWASLFQAKLMAELAGPNEFLDHAEMLSLVLGGGGMNPYALGKHIWEDIKERWDKGRFGRDWELCRDREARKHWDTHAGLGQEKLFEVRRNYNDLTFISEFFTEELFEKLNLFAYEYIPDTGAYHITSRDFEDVKRKLLLKYTHLGRPVIQVAGGNYDNKGELLLLHQWNGIGLEWGQTKQVLKHIYAMWGRPVNLKTIIRRKSKGPDQSRNRIHPERPLTAVLEEQGVLLRYDGERFRELALSPEEVADIRTDDVNYNTIPQEWIG